MLENRYPKRCDPDTLPATNQRERKWLMGVIVRQKKPGKGQPWWVFVSHNGKRTSRQVRDRKAVEKAASDIRAKLQLDGFDFSKRLGHHSPKLTLEIYAEWIPGLKKAGVDELDKKAAPGCTLSALEYHEDVKVELDEKR
jgi:hypothetical protein